MLIARHAAIVGGGFSGTLLAINLLQHGALGVTLVERDPERLARGLAYGSAQANHVLNVRAANMSAFPDQPGHFVDWLARNGLGSETSFATRRNYGRYLSEILSDIRREKGERLTILSGNAVDVVPGPETDRLLFDDRPAIEADMIVLAPGNLPPHDLPAFRDIPLPAYVSDPWSRDIATGLSRDDDVLLLGTGLTAVDCAVTLDSAGFRGRIVAMSRRGLMPHSHAPGAPYQPRSERPVDTAAGLVKQVRARAEAIGWRNAVDELRPYTQDMWASADLARQSRFLRHLRPYWDIHRHRIAPHVAERLETMRAEGRLRIEAGKILAADPHAGGLSVLWRPRGRDERHRLDVARVVNCTGPLGDLNRTRDPLLGNLHAKGLLRPDPHQIGVDVDRAGRTIGRDGRANPRLFMVGPMTRGASWEIVAVPDIRKQVWTLARAATGAHWVEAEGL
jgi:uncharacterized NAD(P)/FAD-binding protein YdhS